MITALIDLDSLLYKACYKVISISQMREALELYEKEQAKQWFLETVYEESINRCENELLKTQQYLQEVFFEEIDSFELFITTCTKSFRKELSSEYKANRKRNKYVWMLRDHYVMNGAEHSDIYEADDLIADRAKELGVGNYIVVSMDKDLKQLGGFYWSYYKTRSKDMEGEYIEDEFGGYVMEYQQKDVDFISKEAAEHIFWTQVLTGDTSDNVKGLWRVGEKTAEKILSKSNRPHIATMREYVKRNQKEDFYINYKLLKLGTKN